MKKSTAAILLVILLFSLCSCVGASFDDDGKQSKAGVVYPEAIAFHDTDVRALRNENPVEDHFLEGVNAFANSLWLDDGADLKNSFVSNAANYFYSSACSVDFSDVDTAEAMAQWISDNTNGTLIPSLETRTDQILSIINTIYSKREKDTMGKWYGKFQSLRSALHVN